MRESERESQESQERERRQRERRQRERREREKTEREREKRKGREGRADQTGSYEYKQHYSQKASDAHREHSGSVSIA